MSPTRRAAGKQPAVNGDEEEADTTRALTMDAFFELIDIRFMDNITVPRRSVVPSRRRRSSTSGILAQLSHADYFLATTVYMPMLEVYGPGVKSVQDKIEFLKAEFETTNEEVKKVPPEVFATFLESSEEDKSGMMVDSFLRP
jgi:kinetochore protein Spc7/SPC105